MAVTTLTQEQVSILFGNGLDVQDLNKRGMNFNPSRLRFWLRNNGTVTIPANMTISAPLNFDLPAWTVTLQGSGHYPSTVTQSPTIFGCTWANAGNWSPSLGAYDYLVDQIFNQNTVPLRIVDRVNTLDPSTRETWDWTSRPWGVDYANEYGIQHGEFQNVIPFNAAGSFMAKTKIEPNEVGEIVFINDVYPVFYRPAPNDIFGFVAGAKKTIPRFIQFSGVVTDYVYISNGLPASFDGGIGDTMKILVATIPQPDTILDLTTGVTALNGWEQNVLTDESGGTPLRRFYDPISGTFFNSIGGCPTGGSHCEDYTSCILGLAADCRSRQTRYRGVHNVYLGLDDFVSIPSRNPFLRVDRDWEGNAHFYFRLEQTPAISASWECGRVFDIVESMRVNSDAETYCHLSPQNPTFSIHTFSTQPSSSEVYSGAILDSSWSVPTSASDYYWRILNDPQQVTDSEGSVGWYVCAIQYASEGGGGGGGGTAESHNLSPAISGTYYSSATVSTDGSVLTLTKSSFPTGITRNWVVQ